MKKPLLVLFLWSLATPALWAQGQIAPDMPKGAPSSIQSQGVSSPIQGSGTLEPDQRWIEQIDGSFAIPSFGAPVDPNPGLGGDINIGYRFNKTLALFIGSGYYQYDIPPAPPATSALLAYIPLVLILRVTFGDGQIHPYLFEGAGIALNTFIQTNAPGTAVLKINRAETDFYLAPGFGVLYRFASDMAVFVQTRVDMDFTSKNNLGIPLGNPSVFIPIQAGISFFAL